MTSVSFGHEVSETINHPLSGRKILGKRWERYEERCNNSRFRFERRSWNPG